MYNNRYFYHRLAEEYSRSQRHNLHLSCLMLDIDFFKEVNDRYGHKAGDNILKELAQLLKHHMRKSDVVARYGGEEFIILLPQTDEGGAMAKAESLRSHIENNPFRGLKGERGLSVSIGLATYPDQRVTNKEDLITFADNALYTAKAQGRNRVVVSNP
jgi:diguanylate cyclase (GGDEF)-like protein